MVERSATTPAPVKEITPEVMAAALGWQAPRLQFFETPLATAVAEFNRRNNRQIVFGDPSLKTVRIDGIFRVDNVDGFVRLVEVTLGVRAESRGEEIVLSRAQ
jgi:transmembrane sensor